MTEYTVYVVQIRKRCSRCKARRKPGMRCCIYVGSTSNSPEERLADHLEPPAGYKRTVVTECGGFIRPDLARGLLFSTREEAEDAEASLAALLSSEGYTVFGGARPNIG